MKRRNRADPLSGSVDALGGSNRKRGRSAKLVLSSHSGDETQDQSSGCRPLSASRAREKLPTKSFAKADASAHSSTRYSVPRKRKREAAQGGDDMQVEMEAQDAGSTRETAIGGTACFDGVAGVKEFENTRPASGEETQQQIYGDLTMRGIHADRTLTAAESPIRAFQKDGTLLRPTSRSNDAPGDSECNYPGLRSSVTGVRDAATEGALALLSLKLKDRPKAPAAYFDSLSAQAQYNANSRS